MAVDIPSGVPYINVISNGNTPTRKGRNMIKKGTVAFIKTTNGGESLVRLLLDYRPTYSVTVEFLTIHGEFDGHPVTITANRLKSIEAVS